MKSNNKILIRCDAAKIAEVGTGHLIRAITLSKILIKKKLLKEDQIIFLLKKDKEYELAKKIMKYEKLNYHTINYKIKDYSKKEINEILKYNFKIVIFDRPGKINKTSINLLKSKNKKIICFDDCSENKFLCDLSFNSLFFKKKYKTKSHFSGFDYNILPSFFFKKKIKYTKIIKKIFISFGGFDNENLLKKNNIVLKTFGENYLLNINKDIPSQKSVNNNERKDFFARMSKSDLVICSGGLTMFDAINLNIPTIAIPIYSHQLKNTKELEKLNVLQRILTKKNLISNLKNKIDKTNRYKVLKMIKKDQLKFTKQNKINLIIQKISHLYEN